MKMYTSVLITACLGFLATTANATPILCQTVVNNHMFMDSTEASACVDAGVGNINGNTTTDDFLTSGGTAAGYVDAGVAATYTTDGTEYGTWSITSAVDAIGFKFGTGNTADEWFIYDLVADTLSGDWTFIDVLAPGKGGDRLSHIQTYNKATSVPEPSIVLLLATGLVVLGVARRKVSA